VAIVHDWLTGMRGGEKVLEAICELYPDAPIYTLVHVRGSVSRSIESRRIHTSVAQWFPSAGRLYRNYLPLYPAIVELLDLDEYDVVISSSHCAAKAVVPAGRAVHVCYCHSPMRYGWDQFDAYFGPDAVGPWRSRLLRPVMACLARWDRATAGRVDAFVANSRYVAGRIRRYYNRGSVVVYPPVDTAFYRPADDPRATDSHFLVVSALVPYKRLDVALEACKRVGAPLKVVGKGPELGRLQRLAGPGVEFLGWRTDEEIRTLYQRAKAVLLPGVEDFGMVPVEAQACGCPAVALGAGGVLETVIDGETGVLAGDSSPEAFADALARVQTLALDRSRIREHALRFSREHFLASFRAVVDDAMRRGRQEAGREAGDPAASSRTAKLPTAKTNQPPPVQKAVREDKQ
jgi:glycosyltransferase involved in cell wall biosynthesis